jgi:hypothetical protein
MQAVQRKFGSWFLVMLYCLTITSVFAVPVDHSQQIVTSSNSEECRSTDSFDHFDHTSQLELQLKSVKEKSEFSASKKIQEQSLYLGFSEIAVIQKLDSCGISEEKETFPFSGTDIIFPFHYFW